MRAGQPQVSPRIAAPPLVYFLNVPTDVLASPGSRLAWRPSRGPASRAALTTYCCRQAGSDEGFVSNVWNFSIKDYFL
jgi:hypothetical protein